MPRLTDRDFLAQRLLLIGEWWDREANAFIDLPTSAQRDLHDFYGPAEAMPDEQALAHRKAMTKAFPSLPQKAGRAFEALRAIKAGEPNRLLDQSPTAKGSTFVSNGRSRRIRVKALAQPRRDPARLARLVIKMMDSDPDGELLKPGRRKRRR